MTEKLPRPFGRYFLTAALGEDALGRVYRAIRDSGDRSFMRLHMLDSPELLADALFDTIEQNGEVHEFLKNPAIGRGVDVDAVDGVPYIAWTEPTGRTLDALLAKCRSLGRPVPVEHALLIAEKVATALDHAYNTTIDGDRTLHGLVWPGFVTTSDDGEIRLSGFGLAPGVLPALGRPRLEREIAPYLAPEERERAAIGKNSDVFSVGVMLLELLTGQPPPSDPLATVKGLAGAPPPPVLPAILSVMRMTLAPPGARYKSSGDLRRELGKLLFSGPYSPSTFNLAYFLNELFREEIAAETEARRREAGSLPSTSPGRAPAPSPQERVAPSAAPPYEPPRGAAAIPSRRTPLAAVGALLAAAAIIGGVWVISRKPAPGGIPGAAPAPTARPMPTLLPEFAQTPSGPTSAMSEAEFRDEVARRVALELRKLEAQVPAKALQTGALFGRAETPVHNVVPDAESVEPIAALEPTASPEPALAEEPPAPALVPTRVAAREGSLVAIDEVDSPPRLSGIVKPTYPPLALHARIGGTVVLRVLVSEKGVPAEIEVVREGRAGLTEAAVKAVRKWTFEPARRDGVPVRTWIAVPIPFEP